VRSLKPSFAAVAVLGAGILAAGWGTSARTSADDVTIGFDDLPSGEVVSTQYHSLGIDFGSPGPVVTEVGSGQARSGKRVASISTSSAAAPEVTGTFTSPAQNVSVYVGQFAASATTVVDGARLTLKAYDANHDLIDRDSADVAPGGGFHSRLSVESDSANIASFEIAARDGTDDNKQLGIDDLSFDAPAPPPVQTTTSTPTPPPPTQPPPPIEGDDGTFTPQKTGRPHFAVAKQPRLQLLMFPFSTRGHAICRQRPGSASLEKPSTLVLRFYLSARAEVSITLKGEAGRRALARFSRQASAGLNRVCLPASFEPLLKRQRASLTVDAISRTLGKSFSGTVGIPCQACDNGPPPPDQFGVRTASLPRSQFPIVAVAGYFAHFYDHAIVANEHLVSELFYSSSYGQLLGVGRSLLFFSLSRIVGVAGFYDPNDQEQHVFVGLQPGGIVEIHWRPVGQYTIQYDLRAFVKGGLTAMTAFPVPTRGWNEFSQHILATDSQGQTWLFLQQNLFHPNEEFVIAVRPGENSFGRQPSLAGYYSRSADAFGLLSASADYVNGVSKFFPFYIGSKLKFGAFRGANGTGNGLEAAGEGKIAAWPPDDDVLVASPKFPGELHEFVPNPPNLPAHPGDCLLRFTTGFYPFVDKLSGNVSYPNMPWCKNVRARLGSSIIALAGFLGARFDHAIVATADGQLRDLAFDDHGEGIG
jgi:hypothetical protein